ncbi:LysR family transcriptional regulator [Paenibacillus sp. p3-SID1389]|uniref:LysR family transcriptional regulator n=1 Tax=Paenibacillus sp. p3-SID1389 TaxID=2916364 RepID=UPI0021A93BF1|nr:LysR family transcriptional regulator [Paenibacillus sp. p3-SID1389]MCT2194126.1 LysR family transcriptional regulator [Paenibacillus sp. p3-SID1389]
MNLHALRLFHVIAETGSVTRASELLNISQPAISAQIRKLEKELGLPLLKAQGRGIALTDVGDKLFTYSRRLFAVEQQIEQFLQDYKMGELGHIFKSQYEHVEMSINTTNSTDALKQLLNLEVDLAIYGGLPETYPESVHAEEMFRDELWFVVSPKHRYAGQRVSLHDMVREPFVMREIGSSTRERFMALCRTYNAQAPRIALQFNGLNETVQAVIAGYGASFVSALVVREYVERGLLSRVFVDGVDLMNTISVYTRKNEPLSPAVQRFVDLIREHPHG